MLAVGRLWPSNLKICLAKHYVLTKKSTCCGRSRQFPFQIIGTLSGHPNTLQTIWALIIGHFSDHPDRTLFRSSGYLSSSTPKGQALVAKMKLWSLNALYWDRRGHGLKVAPKYPPNDQKHLSWPNCKSIYHVLVFWGHFWAIWGYFWSVLGPI